MILILPDVHGRSFWKEPCLNKDQFEKIIFLGDYVAPYTHEGIGNEDAIKIFKEIIDFKKENSDKVVLLLGNHDFSYFDPQICECRTDFENWGKLNKLYFDNIDLFDLAYDIKTEEGRYFFSHAGVRKHWFDTYVRGKWFAWNKETLPKADYFNNALHFHCDNDNFDKIKTALSVYSNFRGWDGDKVGSMVWSDAREWAGDPEYQNVTFICGHTQLNSEPFIKDGYADLDCRKAFVLDIENNSIEPYKYLESSK